MFVDVFKIEHQQRKVYGVIRSTDGKHLMILEKLLNIVEKGSAAFAKLLLEHKKINKGTPFTLKS